MGIDFFEIDNSDFENAKLKNEYIRESQKEWIGFADVSVTSGEEISQILEENDFLKDYDAIVFAFDCVDGEAGVIELLACPQNVILGFCVRREILVKTGSFNELLDGNTNYEFLLRIAESGNVYVVSCDAAKEPFFDVCTMAYIVRRYMVSLKTVGMLDEVFLRYIKTAESYNVSDEFNTWLNDFLADSAEYTNLAENTAPFLILVGDNTCAGVLAGFSRDLADELVALGQAVISTDGRYGDYEHVSTQVLLERNYKAIIGMQAKALESDVFKEMKGKKVQFWFDDPTFFVPFFRNHSKETYVLCQDSNYARYIREHYNISNAVHFPPGGRIVDELPTEKIYDVVFVGSYEPIIEASFLDAAKREFYEYMLKHPDDTFEQGMLALNKENGIVCDAEETVQQLFDWKDVCLGVKNMERHKVIEKILSAGIQLHVFSESWELYQGTGKEHLIIHPTVYDEEPFRVWAQAKIGLNIMRGHKAGMTERIANIMLCGTCCLSDETTCLAEHFSDGEDIVLYKRTELDVLPEKIKYFLEHDEERELIARSGQQKAMKEHTWKKRTEQFLEILYGESEQVETEGMKQGILIPPFPKEYISYSEQEMMEKTEAFYVEMADVYRQADVIHDEYEKKINLLLQNISSSVLLSEVMKEKGVNTLCQTVNEFHVLEKLTKIAEEEELFGEPCVLQNFTSMEEAVHWLQRCVFLIRKFELDKEEAEELSVLVKEGKLSYIYMAEIIRDNCIVRKINATEKIARYLFENGQKREALLLIMRLDQILPYSDKKIMVFAMSLLDMGEFRLAYEILLKYQNPTEDIKQLQNEFEGLV